MRIVFMGTPEFAIPSLNILLKNGYDIVGVVTSTDKYGGRGKKTLLQSPVKKYAEQRNLKILQPPNLKASEFIAQLSALRADLQIIVAFRMLPELVWDMPNLGSYNLHGSLLPQYRGAAPINWAIIKGESRTGVTSFKLKHEIDTGDMLIQRSVPIHFQDTAGDVHDRMMAVGAEVILETVQKIELGDLHFIQQDISRVSKAPKIRKETCQIRFEQPALAIYNHIRGLSPYPGAWMTWMDKSIKVFRTEFEIYKHDQQPGTVIIGKGGQMRVACADGFILICELQPEGKRRMMISEYLRGYNNSP